MKNALPLARFENLVVQELKDEVLVCDLKSNQVFCLNQTAGEVWKLCDGKNELKNISQILSRKFRANFTEEMVLFSIDELFTRNLLAEIGPNNKLFAGVSRREVIKQIGMASMVALPLITFITMPRSIQAQSSCSSPAPDDCPCTQHSDCDSGCCLTNTCQPNLRTGCPCTSCGDCDSGCCFNGVCSSGNACENPDTCGVSSPICSPGFKCCNPSSFDDSSPCVSDFCLCRN